MGKEKPCETAKTLPKEKLLAVVDVGGNSVKCQFFQASSPLIKPDDLPPKIREFCELNGAIGNDGDGAKAARKSALTTLNVIAETIRELRKAGHEVIVKGVGTGPFRDADGALLDATPDFLEKIEKKTGLEIECITGNEEAMLCVKAIKARYGDVSGTIVKMGGSTAEFILMKDGEPQAIKSFPLGTLAIKGQKDKETYIAEWLQKLPEEFKDAGPVFFMGGTPRALSLSFMELRDQKLPEDGEPLLINGQRFLGHCESTTAFRRKLLEHKKVEIDDGHLADALGVNNEARVSLMEYATLLFAQIAAFNHNQDVVPVSVNMRHGQAMRMQQELINAGELVLAA